MHTNIINWSRKEDVIIVIISQSWVCWFILPLPLQSPISPYRGIEAGGKPGFPKGLKGDLVFIVYILKIDVISFGDFY